MERDLAVATPDGLRQLEVERDEQWRVLRNSVRTAFRIGLEQRVGWPVLAMDQGWDLPVFRTFLLIAGEFPRGLAGCEACGYIFRPRRKGHAKRCQRCDKRGPITDVFGGSFNETTGFVYSVPTRHGWKTFRNPKCQGCGEFFKATRADARYCSQRCKTRAHRSAA
jgi:hypothetical protein